VTGPTAVRPVKNHTWGSNTPLRDVLPVPAWWYHIGRAVRWVARNPAKAVGIAGTLYVWGAFGVVGGTVLECVLVACALTGWVAWKSKASGAGLWGTAQALNVERKQRARLRKQWPLACRAAHLTSPSTGAEPRLRKVRSQGQGTFTAELWCGRIGVPVQDVQKQIVDLAEVVGCREVAVTHRGPGVAEIAFHWSDPIGRTLPLVEMPAAPRGQLAYGIRHDGTVASVDMARSLFIGGQTGSGKSTVMWALLADAVRTNTPLRLYVADPKGGVELGVLGDVAGKTGGLIEVRQYAVELADIKKMVESFHGAMKKRQKWAAEHDVYIEDSEQWRTKKGAA